MHEEKENGHVLRQCAVSSIGRTVAAAASTLAKDWLTSEPCCWATSGKIGRLRVLQGLVLRGVHSADRSCETVATLRSTTKSRDMSNRSLLSPGDRSDRDDRGRVRFCWLSVLEIPNDPI